MEYGEQILQKNDAVLLFFVIFALINAIQL